MVGTVDALIREQNITSNWNGGLSIRKYRNFNLENIDNIDLVPKNII